ncbi:unnamed protein product [Euphydryas editha]|uniref:Uncharacterized protein n=1 Tax=Euphydryas editha TaxID=104508 RepID=A0AAU9V3A6_EUPED|nr:unnamed protein product [Euphydryas editha]
MSLFIVYCLYLRVTSEQEPIPLKDEVRAAIKHIKRNKAVGFEIPIETIKATGEIGVDILHTICCRIWVTGAWPSDWSHSIYSSQYIKKDQQKSAAITD